LQIKVSLQAQGKRYKVHKKHDGLEKKKKSQKDAKKKKGGDRTPGTVGLQRKLGDLGAIASA